MRKVFLTYWEALEGKRWRALILLLLSCLAGSMEGVALMTLIPFLNSAMGDSGEANGVWSYFESLQIFSSEELVLAALVTFCTLGVLSALIKFLSDAGTLKLRTQVEKDLRDKMTYALADTEWSGFLFRKMGDISKGMIIEGHQSAYGVSLFLQGVASFLVATIFFCLALVISPKMTFVTMGFCFTAAIVYRKFGVKADKHASTLSDLSSLIGEQVSNIFGNLKFFKATGIASEASNRACQTYRRYADAYFRSHVYANIMRFFFEASGILFIALYLGLTLKVFQKPFSECLVFLALFYRLSPRVLTSYNNFFLAKTYTNWFHTWLERYRLVTSNQQLAKGCEKAIFRKEIRLVSVTFSYPESERPVLENIDFKIGKNECIAIVGESGGGKSTLIDIFTGLLSPQAGTISIDGVALNEIDIQSWRQKIGIVLQDSPLFHGTVLDNIAFGDSNPDLEKVWRCAELAYAADFIKDLPRALDTEVGERGGRLSGGQRQRLALARALYRDPLLLILDEATSALDGESEVKIQQALECIKGQFAVLMISHRLKTVEIADKIIVLKEGHIVEVGSWSGLLKKTDGVFQRMARLQGLGEPNLRLKQVR